MTALQPQAVTGLGSLNGKGDSRMKPFERNGPYDVDVVLLKKLGLPIWQTA
ncbi:hypothetical protein [Verminephrobacter eiseniae]|uniref:hypothetical protein n=1 Tax=Verminephrobacter eiseniae TaxID=364317 RepID=UPI002238D2D2|nr:hypothetical protein [Verminephrobacter eiseniae]